VRDLRGSKWYQKGLADGAAHAAALPEMSPALLKVFRRHRDKGALEDYQRTIRWCTKAGI
jgi:hypothetical protein